jgi:hypothetical protein
MVENTYKLNGDGYIHVSIHDKPSSKIEGLKSISDSSILNKFCNSGYCEMPCYSFRQEKRMPDLKRCLQYNTLLMSGKVLPYDLLPIFFNEAFARLKAFGELQNFNDLKNLVNTCTVNSGTRFSLWSKRKNLIGRFFKRNEKPSNLRLIYSSPKVDLPIDIIPDFFDIGFEVMSKGPINCQRKCKNCMICYDKTRIKKVRELVRY